MCFNTLVFRQIRLANGQIVYLRTIAREAGIGTAIGVAGMIGVPLAGTAALGAVGFTGSGIAAGSMAAGIQAGIGNVVAGSAFATAQSIGATGGLAILGPVGVVAGLVTAGSFFGVKLLWNRRKARLASRPAPKRLFLHI